LFPPSGILHAKSDPGQPENVSPQFFVHIRHNKNSSSPNVQIPKGLLAVCAGMPGGRRGGEKNASGKMVFWQMEREAMEKLILFWHEAETPDNMGAGRILSLPRISKHY
jgi:hypothetical protein